MPVNRFMADELFDAQIKRAIGYSVYGNADPGECLATAGQITRVSADAWYDEWAGTADRAAEEAAESAAKGHRESARVAWFRAANAYRTAGIFLMGAPVDARLTASYRRHVETFRMGAALLDQPPEIVAIPFESGTLPGYFFRVAADGGPCQTAILTGGYDSTVEELYPLNAVAALARGYNVLAFDGPGQGAMIIERGVPFRPDWETVASAVVDFAVGRADVDAKRLVLIGPSFGGYLAPRAASGEHRLAACVSDCGPYDLFDASVSRLPGFLAGQVPDGNHLALSLVERLIGSVMKHPTRGWALRRNLWVHGVDDPMDFFRLARDYTLKGREREIRCPTFVCTAQGDDLSVHARTLYDALRCRKKFVTFTEAEGAGGHCEPLGRTLFHRRVFDWLDEVLAQSATA